MQANLDPIYLRKAEASLVLFIEFNKEMPFDLLSTEKRKLTLSPWLPPLRNISIVVSNDCLLLSKEKRENVEEINLNYAC